MNAKAFAVGAIVTAMGFVAGVLTNRAVSSHSLPGRPAEAISRIDTVVVRDTVTESYPIPVLTTVTDSMLVIVRDTVTIHDTTYIALPRETRYYKGANYEAWLSGYQPRLDRINVFNDTKVITNTTYYKHQVSLFANPIHTETLRVPVGIRYQYSKGQWDFGISAGYDLTCQGVILSTDAKFNVFRW